MRANSWYETMATFPPRARAALSLLGRSRGFLGLDVGAEHLRLIEMQPAGGGFAVSRVCEASLAESTLSAALSEMLRRGAIRTRRVASAVPDSEVIAKRVTIVPPANGNFEAAIHAAAERAIPENLRNVNVDYQVLGVVDEGPQIEVLLVAARTELVDSRAASLRSARLKPVIVDVNSFALLNAFEANYDYPSVGQVALIHLGERYATLNVAQANRSLLAVDAPIAARPVHGDDGTWMNDLVEELHHVISFYWSPVGNDTLAVVYLSGSAACTPALVPLLCERLQAPVELLNPFARQRLHPHIDTVEIRAQAPAYAIALGLALRGMSES